MRTSVGDLKDAVRLRLLTALVQQQRLQERISESDVRQPTLFERHHERHVIERRPKLTLRVRDFRRQHRDVKSERTQQRGKQTIHFITKPATPFLDYLC